MSGARAVIAIAGALIAGCTNARLAHGPIALGPTPTEVELAQPLTSWEHSNKSLTANIEVRSLKDFPIPRGNLVGKYQDDRAIYFLDGRRIQVRATLVLEAGEVIEIDGSTSGCYDVKRYCDIYFEVPGSTRRRLSIHKIHITASEEIVVGGIEWHEGVPK